MARDVIVDWTTQDKPGTGADHFVILLGVTEKTAPLAARTITFPGVATGSYQGAVSVVKVDGTELAPPITFSVTVVDVVPPSMVPTPVTVTAKLV